MKTIKWFSLFVFVFFCTLWIARQTGQNLDSWWTLSGAAAIAAAIVAGFWYKYMVDMVKSTIQTPEVGLGANRTETGQRITHLEREK